MLVASDIIHLIENYDMVKEFIDIKTQLQPAGFDVSLKQVNKIPPLSTIGFSISYVSAGPELPWTSYLDESNCLTLSKGKSYIGVTNEIVELPEFITSLAIPRSSLIRAGVVSNVSMIDPGYKGRLHFLLRPSLDVRVLRNARIAQLIFFSHKTTFSYSGQYQGEGLGQDS